MNQVKDAIAKNLFNALHECNLSDADGDSENDIPSKCSSQDHAFGHIAEALKDLGYQAEYDTYCETGDRPSFCF